MDKVSLTTFVDFVTRAGTPKLTVVRHFKDRDDYDPATDFYKAVREGIVTMHERGNDKSSLDRVLAGLTDGKKKAAYPSIVSGYKKFLGRRAVTWFPPPAAAWGQAGVEVNVNPELGLDIDRTRYVIKLYFKDIKIPANRVSMLNELMRDAFSPTSSASTAKYSVLDVRNAKLYTGAGANPGLLALLKGEAASFRAIYDFLP